MGEIETLVQSAASDSTMQDVSDNSQQDVTATDDTQDNGAQDIVEANEGEKNGGAEDQPTEENNQTEEENGSQEGEDSAPEDGGEKTKEASELSDDELLAELQRRGKMPPQGKEEEEGKQKQEQTDGLEVPSELPSQVWENMDETQRIVYTALPFLEARGKNGEVLRVKAYQQLPKGFEWESEEAKNKFYSVDLPAQSVLAERMRMYLNDQSRVEEQANSEHEFNKYIFDEVNKLIDQGIVPKITTAANADGFNDDAGVKRAEEILDFWDGLRKQGEQISIETAGRLFKAEHPELYRGDNPTDDARKAASRNISGGGRGTRGSAVVPKESDRINSNGFKSVSDIAEEAINQGMF